jgi:hypothetical protein
MVLTEVTRTLPRLVQKANKLIMGLILLTPSEGRKPSLVLHSRDIETVAACADYLAWTTSAHMASAATAFALSS